MISFKACCAENHSYRKKLYSILLTNTDTKALLDGLVYEQTDKYLLRTSKK